MHESTWCKLSEGETQEGVGMVNKSNHFEHQYGPRAHREFQGIEHGVLLVLQLRNVTTSNLSCGRLCRFVRADLQVSWQTTKQNTRP